ncbi:hypothetical protein HOY82DRAFT_666380 [Tuber indicum]|nr:hypothetical protein HOY82DRAFT_666380 [Tuber indicum]
MDEKTDRCCLAEELDPHHLAALMSFTFVNQHDGSRGLDHPSLPIKHRVTDDHCASVRDPTVLDAIAGIAISEAQSPGVAAALQLNSQTQEIHLTIATNQTDTEKLVSHLTAVWGKLQALSNASLISIAHSPRLRHALQYALSISIVPEQTRTVNLPESQGQWQSILEAACTERADWKREKAEEPLKRFELEEGVYPPHPECGLIQYLEVKWDCPWDDIPPLTYIGVSRPSCSACRNWITAFNGLGGQQFYIESTSGKWRWPWVVPIGQDSLGKIMARKVSREYLAYQNRKSPAAISSLVRPRSRLSAEERERVFATFRATEQKYGGRRE